ncbi:MAG TPA: ankyrin repeat domain-containing protein [Candidatus Hydrogenedentes bacterium]|nr:ankyrin repeat domain-containing protein [Candidatus Hydrogenedentota bacterium]
MVSERAEGRHSITLENAQRSPAVLSDSAPRATPEEYYQASLFLTGTADPAYTDAFWRYFTTHDLDPNGSTSYGYTLLDVAISRSETEVAMTLVELGADVNNSAVEMTPAARAAATNNLVLLEFLVAKGADISKITTGKMKPIDYAALNGSRDTYEYLLSKGAISFPASEFNDERRGFSEQTRKSIANEFLFAEDKAAAVAEFYCPTNYMSIIVREGDEVSLREEVSLLPKLVQDDPRALGLALVPVKVGSHLTVCAVRKNRAFVTAHESATGRISCSGWIDVGTLWSQACAPPRLDGYARIQAYGDLERRLNDYYDRQVREAFQLTQEEQEEISLESVTEHWLMPISTEQERAAWIAEAEAQFGRRPADFLDRIPDIQIP